ncbi:glutathione S-transferase [Novosphingobium sp. PhB55]|uniref:glutathione S-transferase n=1 Tax=Novosphingobium sp. PhB55 TaxID=2485106 RepID=UPI001065E5B1|nr:glutathione S-transferase [Novosphingobium sp. PhB55]TDW59630.1 glutathione S-transferase [Novosphingobium sp. PhB55]
MSDFDLYYWPVPFRGQFLRGILAFAGKTWNEHDSHEIADLMGKSPGDQPVPFMGPPVLIDRANDFAIAQMPAIALYLGEKLDLLPATPEGRAASIKVVNDANDVIDELTMDGGREMWDEEEWQEFLPRLERWMAIWEATGRAHGLGDGEGYLLGGDEAGLADVVTAVLWSTMTERFGQIASLLERAAPRVSALVGRMGQRLALARLASDAKERYGDAYCGGEIEESLRKVAC